MIDKIFFTWSAIMAIALSTSMIRSDVKYRRWRKKRDTIINGCGDGKS